MAEGGLSGQELTGARGEIEEMARRAERVARMAGGRFPVELSPYMKSLLKMSREPEAGAPATARRAASF